MFPIILLPYPPSSICYSVHREWRFAGQIVVKTHNVCDIGVISILFSFLLPSLSLLFPPPPTHPLNTRANKVFQVDRECRIAAGRIVVATNNACNIGAMSTPILLRTLDFDRVKSTALI